MRRMDAHDLTDESPPVSPAETESEETNEPIGLADILTTDDELAAALTEIERLAALDPADVVEPAAAIAETLGRLLEEEER